VHVHPRPTGFHDPTSCGVRHRSRARVRRATQPGAPPNARTAQGGGVRRLAAVRRVPGGGDTGRRLAVIRRTGVRSGVVARPGAPLTRLILAYQRAMEGRPSPCRFSPSCSTYALEALEVHGTRRGLWLTVRRLLRCRPFGPSGWDPVPLPRSTDRPRRPDSSEGAR